MSAPDSFALSCFYVDALVKAGGLPICLPALQEPTYIGRAMELLDGFLFVGGKDYLPHHYAGKEQKPKELMETRRDAFDMLLAKSVLENTELPVLGICGGAQLINISLGGTLLQDIASDWLSETGVKPLEHRKGIRHSVFIETASLLSSITKKVKVITNSYHHQAIHPDHLGAGLIITATSNDGVPEAIELSHPRSRFLLGVQWHPERMFDNDPCQQKIFNTFICAAVAHQDKKGT